MVARGLMWVMPDLVVYSERYQVDHTFETNPAVNVQKEHDFDLLLPFDRDYRYIVLTRDFESAVQSWWRLTVGNGGVDDTEENFREFLKGKREYYDAFHGVWMPRVKYNTHGNTQLYEFRQLRMDPAHCLRQIVDFIVRESPTVLRYENNRNEAYSIYSEMCKKWASMPVKPFPYAI